jgi:DNA-binding response OmpR family regulator
MMKPYALVITGNLEKARHYQNALGEVGFQVLSVTTGARAQAQLAFTTPNLIVLDMRLPDIPGRVVLRQINASRRLEKTYLILLSASQNLMEDHDHPAPIRIIDRSVSAADLASLAAEMS